MLLSIDDETLFEGIETKDPTFDLPAVWITDKQKDDVLRFDSNNINQWELQDVVQGVENTMVTYPCEYFHSKYPRQAWGTSPKDCRLVFIMFYKL